MVANVQKEAVEFPLDNNIERALNSGVDKDVKTTPEHEQISDGVHQTPHGRTWVHTLLFGAVVGMAVGVLNVVAYGNGWRLNDWFDLIDLPMNFLTYAAENEFGIRYTGWSLSDPLTWSSIVIDWIVIGVFLAALKRCAADRISRRVIFLAVAGGLIFGVLDAIVRVQRWGMMTEYLNVPDQLIIWAADNEGWRFHFPQGFGYPQILFVIFPFYWACIGFLLASLFCFLRFIRGRKDVTEVGLQAE